MLSDGREGFSELSAWLRDALGLFHRDRKVTPLRPAKIVPCSLKISTLEEGL